MSFLSEKSRFKQNFIRIASANMVAQVIGIASLPILTRIYSPEDFGILTIYTLIQSLLLSVITARIDWLIPNSKTDKRAKQLVISGALVALTLIAIVITVIAIISPQLNSLLKLPQNSKILFLLPFGLLAGAFQLLLQSFHVFDGDLKQVARSKMWQAISTMIFSIILGLLAIKTEGLVIAYIVGFFIAIFILFKAHSQLLVSIKNIEIKSVLNTLTFYKSQLLSSTALSIVNISMTMSITMLLVFYYSTEEVGWYGLVFRLATAPIGLITTALVQSFWAEAAKLVKSDPIKLNKLYISTVKKLSLLAIPLCIIFLLAPYYIPVLFGAEKWGGAGLLLAAVTPYLTGIIVFSPTTHLIVYGKMKLQLIFDLLTLLAVVFIFSLMATIGYEAWQTLFITSFIFLFGYVVRFFLHLKVNSLHIATK